MNAVRGSREWLVQGLDEITSQSRALRAGGCDAGDLVGLEEALQSVIDVAQEMIDELEAQPSPAGQGDALAMIGNNLRSMRVLAGKLTVTQDGNVHLANIQHEIAHALQLLDSAIADRQPVGQEPNGKLVAWWNGITPGYDGQGVPSIRWGADAENSGHDIPLYDGYNPIHYQQPAQAVDLGPRSMDTAPRDGTMVRLLVQFEENATEDTAEPAWTIGACNDDNVGEDERIGWQFAGWCWTHDHFIEGKGTPVGWLPMVEGLAVGK